MPPDLENAPLFKVVGRKKRYDELMEKVYGFSEAAKDSWANLFEYQGSNENVRLRFSIDRLDASLDDVIIIYRDSNGLANENAWESFISDLQEKQVKAQEVSQDLGVRYILEGSVQRAGNRMRINAQLIEAVIAGHTLKNDKSTYDHLTLAIIFYLICLIIQMDPNPSKGVPSFSSP